MYFEEDNGVEYVYKEPKLTSLSEISERLHREYNDKLGADYVKMIMDSSPVSVVCMNHFHATQRVRRSHVVSVYAS